MKLAAALAVPLSALVAVTAVEVLNAAGDAQDVRDQSALAEASLGPSSILEAIEWERNASGVYMLGQQDTFDIAVEDPVEAAALTDAAIDEFAAEIERQGGAVAEAYAPAFEALDGLDALREEVLATPESARNLANIEAVDAVFEDYTDVRDVLASTNRKVALELDDPLLRQGVELIDLNSQQTDLIALLVRDLLLAQIGGDADGVNTPEEIALIAQRRSALGTNFDRIVTTGTGVYVPAVEALLASEEVQKFPRVVDEALDTQSVEVVDVMTYAVNDDPETLAYTVFSEQVQDIVRDRARELEDAAAARRAWFLVLATAALAVAGLAAWLVSRSITRPLRSLTREAKQMAEHRLPLAVADILETPLGEDITVPTVEPVRVRTRDEVADVSAALNRVQDTALDLAVEQAVLRRNIADSFVNLGRRNQNLLGRQLDFITELESNEADPDTLANLFRLDHLATRMRRNAESLLVLAGIEPPRQWAAPVRVTDVIRAALGEVEDYQRVTVRGVEPATILGSAAADLAHLLAELIENALVFSSPDQTVDVRGRNHPAGDGGYGPAYTLAIIDSGLGMSPADLAAANRRLAGDESFTIAPSKYLGHYVAGNLAARHGIAVHLSPSPGNGTTATIELPPGLLTDEAPAASDAAPAAPQVWPLAAPAAGSAAGAAPAPVAAWAPGPHPVAPPPEPAPPATPAPSAAWIPGPGPGGPQAGFAPPVAPDPWAAAPPGDHAPVDPPLPDGRWPSLPSAAPALPEPGEVGRPPGPDDPGTSRRTPSGLVKRTPRVVDAAGRPSGPLGGAGEDALASLRRWSADRAPSPPAAHGAPGDAPRRPADGGPPRVPGDAPRGPVPDPGPVPAPGPVHAGPPPGPNGGPAPQSTPTTGAPGPAARGLPRRVRGAQLPTATPLSLRRRPGGATSPAGGPADGAPPAPSPGPTASPAEGAGSGPSAADDVYSFLSNFTAGVQRGLDESDTTERADNRGER